LNAGWYDEEGAAALKQQGDERVEEVIVERDIQIEYFSCSWCMHSGREAAWPPQLVSCGLLTGQAASRPRLVFWTMWPLCFWTAFTSRVCVHALERTLL